MKIRTSKKTVAEKTVVTRSAKSAAKKSVGRMASAKKTVTFTVHGERGRAVYIAGEFNDWKQEDRFAMKRLAKSNGIWEIKLPAKAMKHGQLYKLIVKWDGGEGERIRRRGGRGGGGTMSDAMERAVA